MITLSKKGSDGGLAMHIRSVILLSMLIVLAMLASASAIQIGRTVEYKGGGMGKVVFDGTLHHDEGYHCMKCHNRYFIPQIGAAKITYESHTARKEFCFGCHNGKEAFDAVGACNRCHKKEN